MFFQYFLQVPQVTLPVPRLERHADTYNDAECATITIQVPTLPNYSLRSASRSPEPRSPVSSIGSSYQGNSTVSEPPRQTIRRGSMVDSDASSAKGVIMHNGHILLMAKESDASYQSHGSASDSLQLSEDLAIHVPFFAKTSDAGSQDNSDSLHLSDDFDDSVDIEQHSQVVPLINKPDAMEGCIIHAENDSNMTKDDGKMLNVEEEYQPLVSNEKSVNSECGIQLGDLRPSQSGAVQGKSLLDIPKVHNFASD